MNRVRMLAAILFCATLAGGCLPPRTTSWPVYIGLLLVLGVLALFGEALSEWILGGDKVTDPLSKRVGRLVLLLVFLIPLVGAVYALITRM